MTGSLVSLQHTHTYAAVNHSPSSTPPPGEQQQLVRKQVHRSPAGGAGRSAYLTGGPKASRFCYTAAGQGHQHLSRTWAILTVRHCKAGWWPSAGYQEPITSIRTVRLSPFAEVNEDDSGSADACDMVQCRERSLLSSAQWFMHAHSLICGTVWFFFLCISTIRSRWAICTLSLMCCLESDEGPIDCAQSICGHPKLA